MINKRFLNFKTYAEFDRLKQAGEIRPESIIWIADTNQMWTHDTFYNSITKEQAEKLAKIISDGNGTKFLTDKLTYEPLPDQATVIDIDGKIMSLTNDSSNEDIVAVFGTLPDFTSLVSVVRNPETILNGILVSEGENLGKIAATIEASSTEESLMVLYFDNIKKMFVSITVTNTDGTLSCVREEFGSVGGDTTPEVSISESEPAPGSKEKVFYQVVEEGTDLGVDSDAPADGNIYGRKDNAWEKIEAAAGKDDIYILDNDLFNEMSGTIEQFVYNELKEAIESNKIIKLKNNNSSENSGITTMYDSISQSGDISLTIFENGVFGILLINPNLSYSVIPKGEVVFKDNVLTKDNSSEYTPTSNYNPATKKYVDDHSPLSKVVTETEYTALGEAVNTDGILYFVTPDE